MKFKLVEDWNRLEEDFQALLEAELAKRATMRGETSLRECLCSLLEWKCGIKLNPNNYMLHHKDGNHFNNDIKNLILLPVGIKYKNPNSHLHNMSSDKITMDKDQSRTKRYRSYLDELDELDGIDVFNSLCSRKLVTVRKKRIEISNISID